MRKSIAARVSSASLIGLVAVLSCVPAVAQPPARQERTAPALEEIVVTAERRSENVQNVPISITVVTGDALEAKGIADVAALTNLAPNVTLDAGTPFSSSDTVLAAYIRGIGQNDFQFNQDPGVGVYVDGVYLARSVGANTTMLDVARVEILKGPQGSLFGRNAIGGAISIVTRDPGEEFSMKGEITVGEFSRLDVKATADLPISDRILSAISFSSLSRDGYQQRMPFVATNVADGAFGNPVANIPDCGAIGTNCSYITEAPDVYPSAGYQSSERQGGQNQWNMRGKVIFLPSDTVKFALAADYTNVDQPAQANTLLSVDPGFFGGAFNGCLSQGTPIPGAIPPGSPPAALVCGPRGGLSPTLRPFLAQPALASINSDGNPANNILPLDGRFIPADIDTTYATGNSFSKLENWGVATTLDWTLSENLSVKWINAYRDLHWSTGLDADGSPVTGLSTSFDMPQRQVSEELQLNGEAIDQRLNYLVGVYYLRETGDLRDLVTFPGGLLTIDSENNVTTEAMALFAHANFKVTERLSVTAGVRYTEEDKEFEGKQADDNGFGYKIAACFPPFSASPVAGLDCRQMLGFPSAAEPFRFYPPGVNRRSFDDTSPTVGAQYQVNDDLMAYASYSEGFKSGSWTTRLSNPQPVYDSSLAFDPETATAQELGLKSEWLDNRLRVNMAAFHTDYEEIQLSSQIGISPTLVNAGDARIYGTEIEAEMLINDRFSINSALGYANAKYTRLNNVSDNGLPLTTTSCPERTSDPNTACDLPKTPEWKFYFGLQHLFERASGATVRINADWTHTSELSNDLGNIERLRRPSVDMLNASVTLAPSDRRWEVSLGGTNLADERYLINGFTNGGISMTFGTYSPPLEWYARFRFFPEGN